MYIGYTMTIYEVHRLFNLDVQPQNDYDINTVNTILRKKYPHLVTSVYHYDKGVCILGSYIETQHFEQHPDIKAYSTILKNVLKEILKIDLSSMNIIKDLKDTHEIMNYPEPFVIIN